MIHKASCSDPADSGRRAENLLQSLREKRLISLYIEPSSRCNLACRFCDFHSGVDSSGITKLKQDMPLPLFELILKELSSLPFRFPFASFFLHGEPLLNRNLARMASLAREAAIADHLSVTTNGILLTGRTFKELTASGINTVVVSLDTVSPQKYASFKQVDALNVVLKHIDACIAMVRSGEVDAEFVVKCTESSGLHGLSSEDMLDVIARFQDVAGDSTRIHVEIQHEFGWYSPAKQTGVPDRSACEVPFYQLCIHSDGHVSPCCMDITQSLSMGRLSDTGPSLRSMLEGDRFRAIRQAQFGPEGNRLEACRRCGHRTHVRLEGIEQEILTLLEAER